jgi:urease accessory protein
METKRVKQPRPGLPKPVSSVQHGNGHEAFDVRLNQQRSSVGSGLFDLNVPVLCTSEAATHWRIWQIADSAFPTGGFAHSNGLEAAWQQGEIRSPDELAGFIRVHLSQTGSAALPFVNEAYHQSQPFADLDRLYDVFVSNHVANRGSRAQGQAFLLAASQSFNLPSLVRLRADLLKEKLPGHFAPVFGTVLQFLKISHSLCLRLFLFMSLRGLLASAVRLGIAGPMAAQVLQSRLQRDAERVACRAWTARVADAAQTSPLLDILHGAHDRLYSRLFQT